MTSNLPPFELERFFARWEFTARYHLTASDAQTMTTDELFALGTARDRAEFGELGLGYTPTWGTDPLRTAIAGTYENIEPEDVLCFAGAEEALYLGLQQLIGPGDHAIVAVPNYQATETIPISTGADVTGFPLWQENNDSRTWTFDLDRLREQLRPNTKLIAVNFPNNPTGFLPNKDTFRQLVELCEEREIRLFSDEVYRGVEDRHEHTLDQAADISSTAISVNVMSKAYGLPGLRIGWIACRDRGLLARLENAKHYTSICNSAPSEFFATLALRNAEALLRRTRSVISANRPIFDEFFAEFSDLFEWQQPSGGCVAFPRYLGKDGASAFCQELVERKGVLFAPATQFSSQLIEVPTDHFRVGIGRTDPNASEALDQVRAFIRERP